MKNPGPPLAEAFDDSPAANRKRLKSLSDESAHYNIGDVIRTINTPTFALKVLRNANVSQFCIRERPAPKRSMECRRGLCVFARLSRLRWSWRARVVRTFTRMGRCGLSRSQPSRLVKLKTGIRRAEISRSK